MAWLFGKKKQQKDALPDSTEEDQNFETRDGYVYLNQDSIPGPPGIDVTALSSDLPKQSNQEEAVHYLSGVPFKLCKQLDSNVNNDLEIDRFRISEILSFVERIENQNYDYDFSLEEGVIAEINSRNTE